MFQYSGAAQDAAPSPRRGRERQGSRLLHRAKRWRSVAQVTQRTKSPWHTTAQQMLGKKAKPKKLLPVSVHSALIQTRHKVRPPARALTCLQAVGLMLLYQRMSGYRKL